MSRKRQGGDLRDRQESKGGKDGGRGVRSKGKGKKKAPEEKAKGDHGAWEKYVEVQETHKNGILF